MDKQTPSTDSPASAVPVPPRATEDARPRRLPGSGRSWIVVGLVAALLKARGLAELLHHRAELIGILGLLVVVSVLRARPILIAVFAAPLVAFALAPSSTALGIAIGVGAFVLLTAAFVAIGTLLQARQ
jgi:uncharacterized membrane protein (DUF485 family)